jgi:chromosome condensin MukBEF complex kleisin-like MukF subunit
MIIRLMGEAQYRVDDSLRERLNTLDDDALAALERSDEEAMDGYLTEMWRLVQSEGELLPASDLDPSDALIPPADLSLEETRQLFAEDGLIPDLPA